MFSHKCLDFIHDLNAAYSNYPKIGNEAYGEMISYVYSLMGTLEIPPFEDALNGVMDLTGFESIYVVSTRKPKDTENTREWLQRNSFNTYLSEISSTNCQKYKGISPIAGSKKVGIAKSIGASILVDDGRHTPNENVQGISCLLFGEAERKEAKFFWKIIRTWKEVLIYIHKMDLVDY